MEMTVLMGNKEQSARGERIDTPPLRFITFLRWFKYLRCCRCCGYFLIIRFLGLGFIPFLRLGFAYPDSTNKLLCTSPGSVEQFFNAHSESKITASFIIMQFNWKIFRILRVFFFIFTFY